MNSITKVIHDVSMLLLLHFTSTVDTKSTVKMFVSFK